MSDAPSDDCSQRDAARDRLRDLVGSASIEVTPKETEAYRGRFQELLAQGTRVYIAKLADRPFEDTIAAAARLRSEAMIPVPHITARSIRSLYELKSLLQRLRELGVKDALVIGGDSGRTEGIYHSAGQLLETGTFDRYGFERIGLAGYPEGTPQIPSQQLHTALVEKVRLANNSNIDFHLVTQFCFSAEKILEWEREIRSVTKGRLKVHVGIPGLTGVGKLLKYAAICGIGQSVKHLRDGAPLLARFRKAWSPEPVALAIGAAVQRDHASSIEAFHFFPFGGFEGTSGWIKGVRQESLSCRG